mgnify:CR=1 FL=1
MMRKLGKLWLWIVYAFLFLPIFVVIAYSFNAAKYTSAWKGFTLKWYSQLFGNAAGFVICIIGMNYKRKRVHHVARKHNVKLYKL